MWRRKKYHFVIFCLFGFVAFLNVSCAPQNNSSQTSAVAYSHIEARDFAPGQLEAHFQKHGAQMGFSAQEDYLAAARDLLNAPTGNEVLEKRRSNGDILHFRPSTGEFAVMTADGRIRTYFRADYRYWLKQ